MTRISAMLATLTLLTAHAGAAKAQPLADDTVVLGAIGDSISSGFNSRNLGDNRDVSWSTGTRPESQSHLKKLTARLGSAVVGRNEAVAGAQARDLGGQVDRVLAFSPDYLTITVGANDVCSWSANHGQALAAFERTLEGHIQRLIAAKPAMRIYLAAIPDMYNLWDVSRVHGGCQQRWNLFGLCAPLLGASRTELERQAFVNRWHDANDALAAVAARHEDNVFFDPAMSTTQFEWQHVSGTDCFHPSVAGQNFISAMTWESGWLE